MPVVSLIFIAYALFGKYLPPPWTHRGYSFERLVGHLYMTLEGVFGTTVEVSSSLIILFTIFGAVLQYSGAGKFFIDFSFAAMGGKRNAAGRAVVLSSFLLGGPSGSGVATTVTIGTVAYPLLEKAGYEKNAAGGLLAAGGLGAIISPPVLGAAAFLIAEFLKISYLDVITMAAIPTILYYFSILVMVELDAAKYGGGGELLVEKGTLWRITRGYWFHFGSLVSIIVFMLYGFSPVLSVFWATMLAIAVSYLRRDTALVPPKLVRALAEGTTGVLSIAATCATAGIIVGVTTLTGLAQRFADIIIGYAQGNLVLTALFSAAIVWVVGLAVPVTASYIMCAVIAAPALIKLGVPDYAAHMFIFYYAVLSEVSPPTALSPFAAAAITGGSPYRTTMQAWKYTMPAFLVPFVFVCDPHRRRSAAAKCRRAAAGSTSSPSTLETLAGIAVLGFAFQGRFLRKSTALETIFFTLGGMLLVFPELIGAILGLARINLAYPHIIALALAALAMLHAVDAAGAERNKPVARNVEYNDAARQGPSPPSSPVARRASARPRPGHWRPRASRSPCFDLNAEAGEKHAKDIGGLFAKCDVTSEAQRRRRAGGGAQGARPGAHPRQLRRHRRGQAHLAPRQGDQRHRAARPRHLRQGDPGQPDRHLPDDVEVRPSACRRPSPSTRTASAA